MYVRPRHYTADAVYGNPPDWPYLAMWKRLLSTGDLFLDVGANRGLYSLWAAQHGACVEAVEPHPSSRRELERNLALNPELRVVIHPLALAEAPGTMRLTRDLESRNHLLEGSRGADGIEVNVSTLDEVLGDRIAAGVKIDVEGAERRVLQGAQQALREGRIRNLQLEWNACSVTNFGESREELSSLLQSVGFRDLIRLDRRGRPVAVENPSSIGSDVFASASSHNCFK